MIRKAIFGNSVLSVVVLAAFVLVLSPAAFAGPLNCSHGSLGRGVASNRMYCGDVQFTTGHNDTRTMGDFASTPGKGLEAVTREFGFRDGGDSRSILPGPQLFKKRLGDMSFDAETQDPSPTPEPSAILLLATGLFGIATTIRRIH